MKKLLSYPVLIRFGLACIFLANSIIAFTAPAEFTELITGSFVTSIIPLSVASIVTLIGINDMIVTLLLLSGWKSQKVGTWATIWIIAVIFIIGPITLDSLEHLAFLSMAVALASHKDN